MLIMGCSRTKLETENPTVDFLNIQVRDDGGLELHDSSRCDENVQILDIFKGRAKYISLWTWV